MMILSARVYRASRDYIGDCRHRICAGDLYVYLYGRADWPDPMSGMRMCLGCMEVHYSPENRPLRIAVVEDPRLTYEVWHYTGGTALVNIREKPGPGLKNGGY